MPTVKGGGWAARAYAAGDHSHNVVWDLLFWAIADALKVPDEAKHPGWKSCVINHTLGHPAKMTCPMPDCREGI